MIKDFFNQHNPIDKTVIGRFGRYAIVRGSFPGGKGIVCRYGFYIPGKDLVPIGDGIALEFDELTQLAELLPALVSSGEIRRTTPREEYAAAVEAREAARKTPMQLW